MNSHAYLRAYMAGVAVPTVFLLFVFAAFCVIRFGYNPVFPFERVLMFPLALVPAIWGIWNMAYLALRRHRSRRYSIGVHGAVVPLVLVPLALRTAGVLGFEFPVDVLRLVLISVPLLIVLYYLLWRYLVAFLNEVLGIA